MKQWQKNTVSVRFHSYTVPMRIRTVTRWKRYWLLSAIRIFRYTNHMKKSHRWKSRRFWMRSRENLRSLWSADCSFVPWNRQDIRLGAADISDWQLSIIVISLHRSEDILICRSTGSSKRRSVAGWIRRKKCIMRRFSGMWQIRPVRWNAEPKR